VSISESAATLAADVLGIDTAKRLADSRIPGQPAREAAVEANEGDPAGAANLEKVDHVVVVMLENRSFDHIRASGARRDGWTAGS
jgi:phospholipase C